MEHYLQSLRDHIQENKSQFEETWSQQCLDMLWWHYWEYHNIDNEVVKAKYHALCMQFEALFPQSSDHLLSEVSSLCVEYERLSFLAGLRLGAQLMLELHNSGTQ